MIVRVAVCQAAPVPFDPPAAARKAADLARRAADDGARLVLLPEAYIPAYPRGFDFGVVVGDRSPAGRELHGRLCETAVSVPGPETEILARAARDARVWLAVGVVERVPRRIGSLYCSLLLFDPDGRLALRHRKLKPTGAERLVWAEGDGSSLRAVQTPFARVGGLICWENYMPLARAALYADGLDIHLAPTADARDVWQATLRHIALEGRCFVLGCNQFARWTDYPDDWRAALPPDHPARAAPASAPAPPVVACRGGSAVYGPLGEIVAGPVFDREEILLADLDLHAIPRARFDFDPVGHYARPDILELRVDRNPRPGVRFLRRPPAPASESESESEPDFDPATAADVPIRPRPGKVVDSPPPDDTMN